MEMTVFAIYDSKAEYYKNPFMMRSKGEAIRGFADVANDESTEIGKHPEDFILFKIAVFDTDKAEYINTPHESLGVAIEYKNPIAKKEIV
jgi:hypothetical protein